MLFNVNARTLESEKERNLYYKFFAGYLFNELVPGAEVRRAAFFRHVSERAAAQHLPFPPIKTLIPLNCHVSFDNHAYLFGYPDDRGEFADVLLTLYNPANMHPQFILPIEVKFLQDWDPVDDISTNLNRINYLCDLLHFPQNTGRMFCLLWKRSKSINAQNNPNSHYNHLPEALRQQTLFLIWEDILDFEGCVPDNIIRNYMAERLNHPTPWRYHITPQGFEEFTPQ